MVNPEWLQGVPEAIRPVYHCERVNQPITLLEGQARLVDPKTGATYECEGELTLQWLPKPRLEISLGTEEVAAIALLGCIHSDDQLLTVEFTDTATILRFLPTRIGTTISGQSRTQVTGEAEEPLTVGTTQEADYAILHLVNFCNYIGSPVQDTKGSQVRCYTARLELLTQEWQITIDQNPDIQDIESQLRRGGYAITHAVKVERVDRKPFSSEALRELLEPLGLFLSFLRGAWSVPVLAVGFDSKGNRCWEMWATPYLGRIHSGGPQVNWFPERSLNIASPLSSILTRLLELWRDIEWRKALLLSISWYVEANGAQELVEGQLVTTQIALELLSWRIIVEDGQLENEESFRRGIFRTAEAKIDRLLRWAGIPGDIPSECHYLSRHAAQKGWSRGTQAITKLRNIIVHASKESRDEYHNTGTLVLWDASQLALLYLELVLLRLLGYEGVYHNRIKRCWTGKVEPVPWARRDARQDASASEQDN